MTDQSLRRADNLLTELVDLVETARTVPMSSSCMLSREQMLDLLDDLREVLPPEIEEARRVIAGRDALLHDAYSEATATRDRASGEAESVRQGAQSHAGQLVHTAEVKAYEILEQGRAEHANLVSATRVHQDATAAAAQLLRDATEFDHVTREAADSYRDHARREADRYSADVRAEAEGYAAKLIADSEDYAERTLAELAGVLHRAAATADQGRVAIAERRARSAQQYAQPHLEHGGADEAGSEPRDPAVEQPGKGVSEGYEQWRDAAISA